VFAASLIIGLLVASRAIGALTGHGLHGPSRLSSVEAPAAKWTEATATLVAAGEGVLD